MASLPLVGVMWSKFTKGLDTVFDQAVENLAVMRLDSAMTLPFDSDAHFITYFPVNTANRDAQGQPVWPRCNKACLGGLRSFGADLVTTMLVVEYDNPSHKPWPESGDTPQAWIERLHLLAQVFPLAMQWTLCYATRAGMRLIYCLSKYVPVDVAEGKHFWMCQEFGRLGLPLAIDTSDWSRAWRLPNVIRDGVKTWEDPRYLMLTQWGNRLDPDPLPYVLPSKSALYAPIEHFNEPQPDGDECHLLLETMNEKTGRWNSTEWSKRAKARLAGRECYGALFEGKPIAAKGSRNTTITAMVGQATSLLRAIESTTAAHVFALFRPAVMQLEIDRDTPDWLKVLWDIVGRTWAKEQAKIKMQEHETARIQTEAGDTARRMIEGFRKHHPHPILDTDDAIPFILRRAIIGCHDSYYVIRPDGFYDPLPLKQGHIISRIRTLGMDKFLETQKFSETEVTNRNAKDLIDEYSTLVANIRGVPDLDGGFIQNLDRDNATLVLPLYRLNRLLEPRFDAEVDRWLQFLFGQHYEIGVRWLAQSLHFERPICALSIDADPGVGKKLLVQGLAECLEVPSVASARDLVGDYQYGLMASPFVNINEGWPQGQIRGMHPADAFRHYTGGDASSVARKFLAPVSIRSPLRIIFTANNSNIVETLTQGKTLTYADRVAIGERLLHLKLGDDAATWLKMKGGIQYTGGKGRRWIAPDGGGVSDFILARHFLFLHANRPRMDNERLLVMGNANVDLMDEMRTRAGKSGIIIETIIKMLGRRPMAEGTACEYEDRVFVCSSAIIEFFRSVMSQTTREKITIPEITQVLRNICVASPSNSYLLPGQHHLGPRRWWELDLDLLQTVARRDGWRCPLVDSLLDIRRAKTNLAKQEMKANAGPGPQLQQPGQSEFRTPASNIGQPRFEPSRQSAGHSPADQYDSDGDGAEYTTHRGVTGTGHYGNIFQPDPSRQYGG